MCARLLFCVDVEQTFPICESFQIHCIHCAVCAEPVHVSFAAKGINPSIKHHLKGTKMALWSELIPKWHHSDNKDRKYHLLDDYDNATLFDPRGVKPADYQPIEISPPPTLSPPSTTIATTTPFVTSPKPVRTTVKSWIQKQVTKTAPRRRGKPAATTPLPAQVDDAANAPGVNAASLPPRYLVAIAACLGIACVLMFACACYFRNQLNEERKLHEHDMTREQSAQMLDSLRDGEYCAAKSNSDSDGDMSFGMMPSPVTSGQYPVIDDVDHLSPTVCMTNTLPRHSRSPIPVCPPQPPFATLPVGAHAQNHVNHQHPVQQYHTIHAQHHHSNCSAKHIRHDDHQCLPSPPSGSHGNAKLNSSSCCAPSCPQQQQQQQHNVNKQDNTIQCPSRTVKSNGKVQNAPDQNGDRPATNAQQVQRSASSGDVLQTVSGQQQTTVRGSLKRELPVQNSTDLHLKSPSTDV